MAKDHSLALRKAIVTRQRADAAVSAIVGTRAYGMHVPAGAEWPYTRYGSPLASIYETSKTDGSDSDIIVHAFAKGPGEDECANLCAAVVACLTGDELPLADGLDLVSLDWVSTQILDQPEDDGYHGIVRFRAITEE